MIICCRIQIRLHFKITFKVLQEYARNMLVLNCIILCCTSHLVNKILQMFQMPLSYQLCIYCKSYTVDISSYFILVSYIVLFVCKKSWPTMPLKCSYGLRFSISLSHQGPARKPKLIKQGVTIFTKLNEN